MSLERDLDTLYAAPLAEFVEQRKALAARFRKAGDKEQATEIAALAKPTPAAWAVNALWRMRRAKVEELLDLGERLRAALRASFAGKGDPKAASALQQEQRDAVDRLVRGAHQLLQEGGASSSQQVVEKVAATLRAVSTTGSWDGGAPGRLARELETPDLATIAALLGADGTRSTRASASPPRHGAAGSRPAAAKSEERARSAPRATGETAGEAGKGRDEARARAHDRAVEKAEAALARAVDREGAAKESADRAAGVAERARAEAKEAGAEVRAATRAAEEAEAAAEEARRAAEAARAAVHAVEKKVATAERRSAEAEDRSARARTDLDEARAAREEAKAALAEVRQAGT